MDVLQATIEEFQELSRAKLVEFQALIDGHQCLKDSRTGSRAAWSNKNSRQSLASAFTNGLNQSKNV
jgi:hypothetical protein